MPKEDSTSPITPSGPRLQSDDVGLAHFAKPPPRRNQRRSSNKCFVYTLAPIVILRTAFLGFALTVCIKTPKLRLRHIDVKSLNYSTATSFSAPSSASPVGEAVLWNTNFGGRRVGARERLRVTVKMEVRSSELVANIDRSRSLASNVSSNIA
ncbi:hypothetical protein ACJRO7_027947 [Eucalyptus globulus]|uniref:Uncharacterized protein n=1 Tax=Eucalyptus globulus TaxID=34317 RepID=A0ABD3JYR9_EUCGL